jgi:PGF-CTERM protein
MYDVNFGGIEHMTKRLTIALVAVAMFVLLAVMPASAYVVAQNVTNTAATVFIGEEGLNLTTIQVGDNRFSNGGTVDTIGWWASSAATTTSPQKTLSLVGRNTSFQVTASDFVGYTGVWYAYNNSNTVVHPAFFTVVDPSLDIKVWDFRLNTDVTGKSIVQGQPLGFRVDTNMYSAINSPTTRFPVAASTSPGAPDGNTLPMGGTWFATTPNDGYIDIKVKDESGTTLTKLVNDSYNNGAQYSNPLTRLNVSSAAWMWGTNSATWMPGSTAATPFYANWSTAATDANGQYVYPPGTYTITAESILNNMKDNYKNAGADFTGKTVSQSYTITLVSSTVKIEANKDSVVRSKPFSVTITGKPSTMYHVWVKGTSTMGGGYDDQPPMIAQNQASVAMDAAIAASSGASQLLNAGNYSYQNGGDVVLDATGLPTSGTIYNDVCRPSDFTATVVAAGTQLSTKAFKLGNGTYLYANVTTSTSGTRTIEFLTTNWTKAQSYTIRVEQQFDGTAATLSKSVVGQQYTYGSGSYKSDEVNVKVEKGAVTIVAAGDQSYYLGEEIKFSGTNTDSYKTYLFIIGPNLQQYGSQIQSSDPRNNAVTPGTESTFQIANVQGDNTWSWKWGTANVALDAGTYTVYAVSRPSDAQATNLAKSAYGTVSIIIKKPFVSATASQSTVAKGDKLFITGTAEGKPSVGVQIWVLGKNKALLAAESVNSDSSFKYELTQDATKNLYAGQYFVVVQHPMQNNKFDIYAGTAVGASTTDLAQTTAVNVYNRILGGGQQIFRLTGAGSLQGSDAAEALVQGINDPNVDDTYTKLQFLVEEPVIRVDPVGDKHVGDKFTITAQTNLAVDDEVLVQVYSSSFKPTQKSQSGEFSGATGTVKVTKGDSGMNKISFDVDSSTFKPDEYLVTESAVIQVATGTALFNVLEGAAPTAVPTKAVVTTAAPTPVPTTVVTTAAPTPVPTTKSPGYGALIALIGLGAVAFIVVRRH